MALPRSAEEERSRRRETATGAAGGGGTTATAGGPPRRATRDGEGGLPTATPSLLMGTATIGGMEWRDEEPAAVGWACGWLGEGATRPPMRKAGTTARRGDATAAASPSPPTAAPAATEPAPAGMNTLVGMPPALNSVSVEARRGRGPASTCEVGRPAVGGVAAMEGGRFGAGEYAQPGGRTGRQRRSANAQQPEVGGHAPQLAHLRPPARTAAPPRPLPMGLRDRPPPPGAAARHSASARLSRPPLSSPVGK